MDPMSKYPKTGAGNAWSTIAADPARNLVFVRPAAPPRLLRGERLGDNQFANSVAALAPYPASSSGISNRSSRSLDYDVATPPAAFRHSSQRSTVPAIAIGSRPATFSS